MTNQKQSLHALSDTFQAMSDNLYDLVEGVNRSSEQLSKITEQLDVSGIVKDLTFEADELVHAIGRKVEARRALSETEEELDSFSRTLTLEFLQSEQAQKKDPATGRKNKGYTGMLLEEFLASHETHQDILQERDEAQIVYKQRSRDVEQYRVLFRAARYKADLAGSLLQFLSVPGRTMANIESTLSEEA